MFGNCLKTKHSDINNIQWHLLDDGVGKIGKASGMKIEYSMSDELDFAQKLSIKMRKQLMRLLKQNENAMYQQELNNIGRLYSRDSVCEEVRKCSRNQTNVKQKYMYNAQVSQLGKLFGVYDD